MTARDFTASGEEITSLIDVRDNMLELLEAHDFMSEALHHLLLSDEAEPSAHGLSVILRALRYRERALMRAVDNLLGKQRAATDDD